MNTAGSEHPSKSGTVYVYSNACGLFMSFSCNKQAMMNAAKEDVPEESYVSENKPPEPGWTGTKQLT